MSNEVVVYSPAIYAALKVLACALYNAQQRGYLMDSDAMKDYAHTRKLWGIACRVVGRPRVVVCDRPYPVKCRQITVKKTKKTSPVIAWMALAGEQAPNRRSILLKQGGVVYDDDKTIGTLYIPQRHMELWDGWDRNVATIWRDIFLPGLGTAPKGVTS
jgi:hypothetical protein